MPAIVPRFNFTEDPLNAPNVTLQLGPNPAVLLDIWLIAYTLGQILMLLLVGTLLWKRRAIGSGRSWRGLTLINMLLTMFLNSTINLILYYAGESANPDPPPGLCLVQATLRHGSGPMTEVAIMSLAIETFLSTRGAVNMKKLPVGIIVLLLLLPYFSFFLWAIPIAVMGMAHPLKIHRLGQAFYCTYSNNMYGDVTTLYGVLAILITAVIQSFTARFLHRTWRTTRDLRASGGIDLSLVVRIWVFTGFQILFILMTVLDLPLAASPKRMLDQAIEVFQSLVPVIAFVLFGLRSSILELWFWWWPRFVSRAAGENREDSSVVFKTHSASPSTAPSVCDST